MSPRISNYIPTTHIVGKCDDLTTIQNQLSEFIDNIMDGRSLSDAIAELDSDNSVWTTEGKTIIKTGKQVCGIILDFYSREGYIPYLDDFLEFADNNGFHIQVDDFYCDDLLDDFLQAVNETLPESNRQGKIDYLELLEQVDKCLDEDIATFEFGEWSNVLDEIDTNNENNNENRRDNIDAIDVRRKKIFKIGNDSDSDSNKSPKDRANSSSSIDSALG